MSWIFRLLFINLLAFNLYGQQPAYFLFGEKEFEGVDIYNLIQDNDHNYWFATDQGIIKYDGYTFKSIECNSMKSNVVFNFVKDSKGVIYCHNLNHQIFKIEKGKCSLFFEIPETGKGTDIYLLTSKKEELIIASGEAYAVNSKGKIISSTEKIKHNYIAQPFLLSDGRILCSESTPPNAIIYSNKKFKKIQLKIEKSKKITNILQFYRINKQCFAVNFESKTFYSFNEKEIKIENQFPELKLNKNEHLRYYLEGNLFWIASNVNGVKVFDNNLKARFSSDKIFSDFFISKVYKDLQGNLLLATFDKGIIVIPNLNMNSGIDELKEYKISKIRFQNNENLFLGTNDGAVLRFTNGQIYRLSSLGNKSIESLYKWKNKPFILFDNNGLTIQNVETKQKFNFLSTAYKCAAQKGKNEVFIGSNLGVGILNYRPLGADFNYKPISNLKRRVYDLLVIPNSKNLLVATIDGLKILKNNNQVNSILFKGKEIYASSLFSDNNVVYIATKRNGFFIYDEGRISQHFTPQFKGERIQFFKLRIRNRIMYAITNIGFLAINLNSKKIKKIDKSFGLISDKVIDFEIAGNILLVSSIEGVQEINLSFNRFNSNKPNFTISRIEVNNKLITKTNDFQSSHKKFSFLLSTPTISNKENIYYYYKLLPNDKNWEINKYENNRITYNSLEPGTYTFIAKAENNGAFSSAKKFTFTIDSPFYKKWWFNLFGILIISGIIILFYKRKLKKQQIKADLLNELNASKLIAIQSQMNPHFIFNSLNSIQDLVLKGDVTNSYTFITKFSNLVRRTLNYSDKDFIDFEQEIKLLELYLALEKLRFKENLEIDFDISKTADIQVPPMLIQPFIENALIHGLLHKEGLKKLKIEFSLKDEILICEITDNGVGRAKAKEIKERQRSEHESFAIGAIKKRFDILEKHYNGKLGFEYVDLKNDQEILGTKVIIRIPIIHKF